MMDKAEVVNDPAERNKAWGEIDKAITEDGGEHPVAVGQAADAEVRRTSTAWSTRRTPPGT